LFLYDELNFIAKEFEGFKSLFPANSKFYIPNALKIIKLYILIRKIGTKLDKNSETLQIFTINFLKELEMTYSNDQNYQVSKVKI
jgi:hypothetical protein